jgi:hypothetical protein
MSSTVLLDQHCHRANDAARNSDYWSCEENDQSALLKFGAIQQSGNRQDSHSADDSPDYSANHSGQQDSRHKLHGFYGGVLSLIWQRNYAPARIRGSFLCSLRRRPFQSGFFKLLPVGACKNRRFPGAPALQQAGQKNRRHSYRHKNHRRFESVNATLTQEMSQGLEKVR